MNNTNQTYEEAVDLPHLTLPNLFCAVYRDSDYRFGKLHFGEPMGEDNYPEYMVEPPEFMRSGWTYFHEIPIVLHPEKGVLLFRMEGCRDDPPELLSGRIERGHKELTNLEWKLRHRLEKIGYWKDRPIVMGVGIVTPCQCTAEHRPVSVDSEVIISREEIPHFAERVDALFDYYTIDAARPIDQWGDRLIADITGSTDILGGYVAEETLLEMYDDFDRPLTGLVEPVS